MPKCDLPEHLRERKHNDWPIGLKWVPRGWNAFSHRCSGWRKVPILLVGYNCTRWMTPGDRDVIHVLSKTGLSFGGINMPDYGPSPLQKFSKWGFSLVWPLHFEFHYIIGDSTIEYSNQGVIISGDKVLLFRIGARWDSYDSYYNIGPYIGLAWN